MPPTRDLTPLQQRVLAVLSVGSTVTAAAQLVGVHRNTVRNWQRSVPFREALRETRHGQNLAWNEQTQSLAGQALGAIQSLLADPQAPAAVRLQAALSIHRRPPATSSAPPKTQPPPPKPAAAQPGRNQPCPCCSGRKFKRCCMPGH
jgi:uncharacterized protein YecA (UPF0149 family)